MDMENFNILPPYHQFHTSDYIPEIIQFIQKLVTNGFGYELNSSIYFGSPLDIRTGDIDRKSSHHDNKIDQSDAYYNNNSPVNNCFHINHLTINGCILYKN